MATIIVEDDPQNLFTDATTETKPVLKPKTKGGNNKLFAMVTPATDEDAVGKPETSEHHRAGVVVTPGENHTALEDNENESPQEPCRTLFPSKALVVTPAKSSHKRDASSASGAPLAKRRLIFGKYIDLIQCQANVQKVYKLVRKLTGSIGGNGYCGPIYGELTMGSMQKMIDLMMDHTDLNATSRFIDVGSGIGKPNLHVAQYPGVSFSCGVEMEHSRWVLGMTCLKAVVNAAFVEQSSSIGMPEEESIQGNTAFLHKNITEAKTFDPFTHVYMFSIGFPPPLWLELSEMWNRSQSEYLICYHSPKDIIRSYEFDCELLAQTQTSMHGSKEGHTGYIYQRKTPRRTDVNACDALFRESWDLVRRGLAPLRQDVNRQVQEAMGTGRRTRSRR